MEISQQIEAVYRRALLLRQYATEVPAQDNLLEKVLQELYFVLEELQTSQEELSQQNQALLAARQFADLEHRRYQALFDLAPNGYVVTDRQGNIQEANHYAATHLFRTSQEYLMNKPLLVFIHEPDRPYFQAQLANLNPRQNWDITLKSHRGAPIPVAIAVTWIKNAQWYGDMLLWSLNDTALGKQLETVHSDSHPSEVHPPAQNTCQSGSDRTP